MNLHLLRVFFTVVEREGFSRAAEALFVSQSAVSKAVRELEHQTGLPLIERGGAGQGARTVRLTDHGRALYEHARGIFAMERIAIEDVRDRVGLLRGRLRLGASTTIGGYWLPEYLSAFAARHPQIELTLTVANTQAVAEAVIDCSVDLGLVEGPVDDERIVSEPWRDEPLRIVAAAGSRVAARGRATPDALSAHTWLMREAGSGTRDVAERLLAQHGIVPRRTIEIGSNEAIAHSVAAGAGLAMLPWAVVADLVALRRLVRVGFAQESQFARPLYRLELANRPRSPALQGFLAVLAQPASSPHASAAIDKNR